MKVSAYIGTQRTQVYEQELLAMIQETILLFIKSEDSEDPSWA